jgi:hypothetical protein
MKIWVVKEQKRAETFHRVSMPRNLCLFYDCSSADSFESSCHKNVYRVHGNEADREKNPVMKLKMLSKRIKPREVLRFSVNELKAVQRKQPSQRDKSRHMNSFVKKTISLCHHSSFELPNSNTTRTQRKFYPIR